MDAYVPRSLQEQIFYVQITLLNHQVVVQVLINEYFLNMGDSHNINKNSLKV